MSSLYVRAGALLLAAMAGFAIAWGWQANAYDAKLAAQQSLHKADLSVIASAGAEQSRQSLAKQQSAERALAALDQKNTQEKEALNAKNESLRRAVADGARRLRIAGSCVASGGAVPGSASTTSLGNDASVELSANAGRSVLDIRAAIIADQAALRAAQAYIRDVCQ